jgi:micrococcal nuclease
MLIFNMRIPKKVILIPVFLLLLLLVRYVSDIGLDRTPDARFHVIKVIDGDTIELTGGERLRLLGIDTPERGEPFYDSARVFLRGLVEGKNLEVSFSKKRRDNYGRLLGYIYVDSLFINKEIIKQGLAYLYLFEDNLSDYDKTSQLQAAQNEAMTGGRNIWSIKRTPENYYQTRKGSLRFHRPFCNSVKKLKPNELLKFSTWEEALRGGYSPCRNCRP